MKVKDELLNKSQLKSLSKIISKQAMIWAVLPGQILILHTLKIEELNPKIELAIRYALLFQFPSTIVQRLANDEQSYLFRPITTLILILATSILGYTAYAFFTNELTPPISFFGLSLWPLANKYFFISQSKARNRSIFFSALISTTLFSTAIYFSPDLASFSGRVSFLILFILLSRMGQK